MCWDLEQIEKENPGGEAPLMNNIQLENFNWNEVHVYVTNACNIIKHACIMHRKTAGTQTVCTENIMNAEKGFYHYLHRKNQRKQLHQINTQSIYWYNMMDITSTTTINITCNILTCYEVYSQEWLPISVQRISVQQRRQQAHIE